MVSYDAHQAKDQMVHMEEAALKRGRDVSDCEGTWSPCKKLRADSPADKVAFCQRTTALFFQLQVQELYLPPYSFPRVYVSSPLQGPVAEPLCLQREVAAQVLDARKKRAANIEESRRIAEQNPLQPRSLTPVLHHASPEPCGVPVDSKRCSASRETPSMGPVKAGSCEGPVHARYLSFLASFSPEQQAPAKMEQACGAILSEIPMSPISLTPSAVIWSSGKHAVRFPIGPPCKIATKIFSTIRNFPYCSIFPSGGAQRTAAGCLACAACDECFPSSFLGLQPYVYVVFREDVVGSLLFYLYFTWQGFLADSFRVSMKLYHIIPTF